MIYKVGDTLQFQRTGVNVKERGVLVQTQELGNPSIVVYFVKLHDSASILHLTYDEIECVIISGFHTIIEELECI